MKLPPFNGSLPIKDDGSYADGARTSGEYASENPGCASTCVARLGDVELDTNIAGKLWSRERQSVHRLTRAIGFPHSVDAYFVGLQLEPARAAL